PDPATFLLGPALPDQRSGEPVTVLGEVVAEASLHAGGALVGTPLLDPGRGDPHDLAILHLEIDLAADAAVGTNRAGDGVRLPHRLRAEALLGDELEDGAGGTDANALAAPGAAGVIRVAVAADDDLGRGPTLGHVQHADLLDVLAGSDAAGAEDAEAHVVLDHHVARPLVAGAEREVPPGPDRHVVADDVLLELVARMGSSAIGQVLARVALEQEFEDAAAALHRRLGLGLNHHALRRRGVAGRGQLALSLDRDQADAAVGDGGELGIPAEGRNV